MPAVSSTLTCIGIDWADKEHVFHLIPSTGRAQAGRFCHEPDVIHDTVESWKREFPDTTIAIAIEQSRGPLINALLTHEGLEIYPINPASLASYRKAFAHGGGKNDPTDAMLLARYVQHYRDTLRPLKPADPLTRELASLCEDRRDLVDQRADLANQLRAVLKLYFPVILKLDASQMYADFLLKFLSKFPTLEAAQKAGATRLRKYFFGIGTPRKAEERIELLLNASPLTSDEVLIRCSRRRVLALVDILKSLNESIDQYDDEIHRLVRQHADYPIVASLPGAADVTHCRIIAALGDDRNRYASAESLQAATGIAPLTHQSGKQKTVTCRWAASKFLKQTFHEFAGLSITRSTWAAAYYQQQINAGKKPQMARRALAYKWLRIIYRCWKDRVPYNEEKYIQRLKDTGSPLAKLIS